MLLQDRPPALVDAIAAMTDDDLWTLLRTDPRTADAATGLRNDPASWTINAGDDLAGIDFAVTRLYLDPPAS